MPRFKPRKRENAHSRDIRLGASIGRSALHPGRLIIAPNTQNTFESTEKPLAYRRSHLRKRPNQSMELTATRRVSTFQMSKSLSLRATLALGSGSSSCSR
jgi:hypothetical protein